MEKIAIGWTAVAAFVPGRLGNHLNKSSSAARLENSEIEFK